MTKECGQSEVSWWCGEVRAQGKGGQTVSILNQTWSTDYVWVTYTCRLGYSTKTLVCCSGAHFIRKWPVKYANHVQKSIEINI